MEKETGTKIDLTKGFDSEANDGLFDVIDDKDPFKSDLTETDFSKVGDFKEDLGEKKEEGIEDKAEEKSQKRKGSERDSGLSQTFMVSARGSVVLYNLLISRVCSVISGYEPGRYKFSKEEQEELTLALAAYSEETGLQLTPTQRLIISFTILTSSLLFSAIEDRMKRKEVSKSVKKTVSENEKQDDLLVSRRVEAKKSPFGIRNQFTIHGKTGCFNYSESGKYLKIEEATEKAPDWIIKDYEEFFVGQNWSKGRFNTFIKDKISQINNL